MSSVHVFLLILEDRSFKAIGRVKIRERSYQSGDPVMFHGREAVILGTGATRQEAKVNGTAYYNQVCELHKEKECNWMFNTQDPEEESSSVSANQDTSPEHPRKRRKL